MARCLSAVGTGIAILLVPALLWAAAGDLDLSFDGDGKVTTAVGPGVDYAFSVGIQPADGKIVVAGYATNGSNDDFALARYQPDGSLDTSFDGDGRAMTAIGAGLDNAQALVIQPADGKIVVAGHMYNGANYDFAVARYNSGGSLDISFSGDGKLTTAFGTSNDIAAAIAIQPADGKIVVAGYMHNGANYDFAVARYNSDGSLDTSFDGDGKAATPVGTSHEYATAVAIQPADGKIVVAGYTFSGSNADFALVRYNTDGSLDASFDGDGKVVTAIGASNDIANDIAIQPADGKIVVVGYAIIGTSIDFALARYTSSGALDPTFDGDGKLTTPIGTGTDVANGVAIQPADGKIVVSGYAFMGGNNDFAVARYLTDGSLDASFSGDGKLTTPIGGSDDYAYAVAVQPGDGRIVAAGYAYTGSGYDFAVARYLGNCGNAVVEAGEQCDDGNTTDGDCCSAACQYETAGGPCPNDGLPCTADVCNATGSCTHPAGNPGVECRPAAGVCDPAEQCDGAGTACPPDAKGIALCRAAAGVCDAAEYCDGAGDDCPPDGKSTAVCRPAAGPCDVADSCDGAGDDCPPDAVEPDTTVCRPAAGACDVADTCDGLTVACSDAKSTALCRSAAGVCDAVEQCDGASNDCRADAKRPPATICRPDAGQCDVADACDGVTDDCPADGFESSGLPCDDGDLCTGGETCDGAGSCGGGAPVLCTDHFKCYKAKDLKQPKFQSTVVSLTDQFFGPENTELKKPFLLCNPVDKNGEGITDPSAHLTCYKAKGPKFLTRPQVQAVNQFGSIDLELKKTFLTCIPSTKTLLP